MTRAQAELVATARDSIAAARLLLDNGHEGFAASRAYYAMFYLAQALLEDKGLAFAKHPAVLAAFGREFARAGLVPPEIHRHLLEAQELRHAGDCGPAEAVTAADARRQIERAEAVFTAALSLIEGAVGS